MEEAERIFDRAKKELDIKGVIDLEGNLICKDEYIICLTRYLD